MTESSGPTDLPTPALTLLRGPAFEHLANAAKLPAEDPRLAHFLAHYWQRRAVHLPAALAGFEVPLDADELAGLACEVGADARIVRTVGDGFELTSGPFTAADFEHIGDRDWTLLVNGVDLAIPGFEALLEAVRFVPDWRLDDVMVSFAAPGGSVGPHFDRYDVFLLQASGTRHWQLSAESDGPSRTQLTDTGLNLVADFEPDLEIRCEPGDGLYVPPGVVHHGIAVTPCLTISLGFRAPSLADLVSDWALALAEQETAPPLELDPQLPAHPGALDRATVAAAGRHMRAALESLLADDDAFARQLSGLLTQPGRGAHFEQPEPISAHALQREVAAGAQLERAPGLRMLHYAQDEGRNVVTAGGIEIDTALGSDEFEPFTSLRPLRQGDLTHAAHWALAAELYNAGRLMLMDADT